ncbi:hypothetical protein GCM10017691_08050 [Pseudonocardia petroleophila]|uniref:FHA domain-containing protein n=1 Tax=Pseudonocardia petroleophila TaxID=37331 RepID=A0A7G7MJN0_9PSEU|nr:hypothetical protein [Pseudonocardia petroleophila]QNG52991.1 hypothetical protein H6H00_02800 [Pseudonocardia petroleophila]
MTPLDISHPPPTRWLAVHEGEGPDLRITATRPMPVGTRVTVGREGDVAIGVRTPNRGVSRIAVEVTASPTGWRIAVPNRNGAVMHPWGGPLQVASPVDGIDWPLLGIRLRHTNTSQHWILLSADDLAITPAGPVAGDESSGTDLAGRPSDLSKGTSQAIRVVFHELLSWPPRHPATPLQLKQAATRLGIAPPSVRDRLAVAWDKAAELGVNGIERDLTDPGYLYALVRAGYVRPPRVAPGLAGLRYISSGSHD